MNIQSSFDPNQSVRESASAQRSGAALPGGEAPSDSTFGAKVITDGDTASISPAAIAAASGVTEVRTEKVAAIQQTLANGTYAVSPWDVAGKLIDHLLER
jgi:flagellar biosynthesis anti-sigma factor FlgM